MPKKNFVKGKGRPRRSPMAIQVPRPFRSNPTFTRTFRFISGANESKDADLVTVGSLQNLMFIASAAAAAGSLFASVRLKKVEVWQMAGSAAFAQIALTWLGDRMPNREISATGTPMVPAHIRARPPRGSFAAMWFGGQLAAPALGATNPTLFSLTTPANSVCDVTVEFQMFDTDSFNNQPTVTTAGATAGVLYVNQSLDNTSTTLTAGTKNWTISSAFSSVLNGFISAW